MKWILCAFVLATTLFGGATAVAQNASAARKMDAARSKITIHVSKSGVFSAFAHDHEVEAPIQSGEVNESGSASAELRVNSRELRVLDPKESDETRAKIQQTMLGPQVLDSDRFPEIHFKSTSVDAKGAGHWLVHGNLDLHGQTHPVLVDVALKDGVYRGAAAFKQTDYGIKPVRIAGGSVNVKDELKIEFEIALQ